MWICKYFSWKILSLINKVMASNFFLRIFLVYLLPNSPPFTISKEMKCAEMVISRAYARFLPIFGRLGDPEIVGCGLLWGASYDGYSRLHPITHVSSPFMGGFTPSWVECMVLGRDTLPLFLDEHFCVFCTHFITSWSTWAFSYPFVSPFAFAAPCVIHEVTLGAGLWLRVLVFLASSGLSFCSNRDCLLLEVWCTLFLLFLNCPSSLPLLNESIFPSP